MKILNNNLSRRDCLAHLSNGFGWLAASALLHQATANGKSDDTIETPKPHHAPKAKRVIFCYMSGGVSHVDSFDPKPILKERAGKAMPSPVARTQFNNNGTIYPSPWAFKKYGQSGIPVSDLFPNIGEVVDELAVVRSITAQFSEHAQGNFFMHTGFPFLGHPSAGAWLAYGLGNASENLPGYVVLKSGNSVVPHGGVSLFSSGFLPADFQASLMSVDDAEPIRNVRPREADLLQQKRLSFIEKMDAKFRQATPNNPQIEAAVRNYEMAYRMQSAVPELTDLRDESAETKAMYGMDSEDEGKAAYARQCLLARRLVERDVRFIELSCLAYNIGGGNGANPWDQHGDIEKGHGKMAFQVDQPIAALIKDLKQRDLLKETLIVWAGEFGRTPFSQGSNGRDHNPYGFSIWMAGGGIKGGTIYGATDEFGYEAVEDKCDVYDMWATVLHLMGLDHTRLTYRHGGRDYRLTDVYGNVLKKILA